MGPPTPPCQGTLSSGCDRPCQLTTARRYHPAHIARSHPALYQSLSKSHKLTHTHTHTPVDGINLCITKTIPGQLSSSPLEWPYRSKRLTTAGWCSAIVTASSRDSSGRHPELITPPQCDGAAQHVTSWKTRFESAEQLGAVWPPPPRRQRRPNAAQEAVKSSASIWSPWRWTLASERCLNNQGNWVDVHIWRQRKK